MHSLIAPAQFEITGRCLTTGITTDAVDVFPDC